MTTIAAENTKQIRQPMDVIIQVLMEETATLTFTYTGQKVADGVLNQPDWEMRKLADLQWNGFPLDGSHALYDSTVTASAANGKIGVRGNIGQPVTVSVTASASVDRLTVSATGCRAVEYNGITYSMRNGYSIIPIGGTSAVFVFQPETDTKRVEVSDIQPGSLIRITNDNLISAVVSLRSDLSILEPTLPESEINIEAYFDDDISDILASIPDETPVTYQAGYEGDMSPVRKFYLAEQITWANNVMNIHAVDAVHLLDVDTTTSARINGVTTVLGSESVNYHGSATGLYRFIAFILSEAGIEFNGYEDRAFDRNALRENYIVDKCNKRDLIASVQNLLHQNYPENQFYKVVVTNYWPTYVDAGIPTLSLEKPTPAFHIDESDCGNVELTTERKLSKINVQRRGCAPWNGNSVQIGGADWIKGSGAFLQFDSTFISEYRVAYVRSRTATGANYSTIGSTYDDGDRRVAYPGRPMYGSKFALFNQLLGSDVPKGTILAPPTVSYAGSALNTQVMPWNTQQSNLWDTLAGEETGTEMSLEIIGSAFVITEESETYGSGDIVANIDERKYLGKLVSRNPYAEANEYELYPSGAYESLLQRSNITGSFTWKGDPRMQPRDVFTFHRLDGTDEVCTLENITITHEKGGTSAEITYRRGVC